MKPTRSLDGKMRFTTRIQVRISADDMASALVISYMDHDFESGNPPTPSRIKIINLTKNEIERHGVYAIHGAVIEHTEDIVWDWANKVVADQFPELN